MWNTLVKALVAIIVRLITANFLSKIIVYSLDYLADKTTNTLDDKIVKSVADALDIKL